MRKKPTDFKKSQDLKAEEPRDLKDFKTESFKGPERPIRLPRDSKDLKT